MPATPLQRFTLSTTIRDVEVRISGLCRSGTGRPIVFLHGFGSTKEDYADVVNQPALADRPVLAYDAPGCGGTACADLTQVDIAFLVDTALTVLAHEGIDDFDLVGHSMGGLTALLLAERLRTRVRHFVDIEGNVAPEDCFLSRQIIEHAHADPHAFMAAFVERVGASGDHAGPLYAASLTYKVRAEAVRPIFESMVDVSDNGDLLTRFLALPMPRMLMYGEQNATLSYLPTLEENGIELAEIPACGHFPMYSNPVAMWDHIIRFLK